MTDTQRISVRKGYILLVENDDLIRGLVERWLGEAGYCVVAGSYETCAAGEAPRLVIADISSPRGGEVLIRSLRTMHAAPILALSARFRAGLGASTEAARRLGVSRLLPKPFSRRELLLAVRESVKAAQ